MLAQRKERQNAVRAFKEGAEVAAMAQDFFWPIVQSQRLRTAPIAR